MTAPRFECSPFDRITIDKSIYRPDGQNDDFVRLRHLDGSNACSVFSYSDLEKLRQSSGWRYEKGWFAESAAPIDAAKSPEVMTSALSLEDQERLSWLRVVFGAMDELHEAGELTLSHEGLEKNRPKLAVLVHQRDVERTNVEKKPRGGARVQSHLLPSNSTLLRKYRKYRQTGQTMLPFMPKRSFGRRPVHYDYESQDFLRRSVLKYATAERPSKKEIFERHQDEVTEENVARFLKGQPELRAFSYSTVLRHIRGLDPFFVNAGRLGKERARALASSSSGGLTKLYPMQRIELDEWKVDVRTFLTRLGIIDLLPPDAIAALPKTRRWICVAVDVATRVVVGIRIAKNPSAYDAVRTLAMAVSDKNEFARAIGAQAEWYHHGGLCTVSCDTGPAFLSSEFQTAVSDLGGHIHFGPVGVPELRATVERTFGTFATKFASLLPGRTFSNVTDRGDYDADARAVLDDADLLRIIIRWIVDYYHHAPHSGLQGQTPAARWKELTRERFVPNPPDRLTRRVATGIEVERKLTKHGLRLFSNFYTSENLRKHYAHSSQRKFRVRIDPEDIGSVAYLQDGLWHDAPARDANFEGVSLEAWKAEFAKIVREHREEAKLAQELRSEALRSIREGVQSRLDQLLPGAEAVNAEALESLEDTLFQGKSWRNVVVESTETQDHAFGSLLASKSEPDVIDGESASSDDDASGWEVEDD
ncbi:Mu transposase C-terminal domain-containing protein [uncultured Tateyamaria sp.]|uniref:Mu transposase C-terminal domain-containing protein n=1 Tax=uncultured Tateyamaria sp. TaxID=455651 RepID=UPI002627A431|nr:Mu transposase C-terminal domain-containing protein [uncultured Tateyamaria sp.]